MLSYPYPSDNQTQSNLHYGDQISFKDLAGYFLYAKGFINVSLFLQKQLSPQCYFSVQPKRGITKVHDKKASKIPVIFGTQVLIKHSISQYYLKVIDRNGTTVLFLDKKQSQQSYFTFLPQRTFQHEGDFITTQSIFIIKNVLKHVYINSSQIINLSQEPPQTPFKKYLKKGSRLTGTNYRKRNESVQKQKQNQIKQSQTQHFKFEDKNIAVSISSDQQIRYDFIDQVSIFQNSQQSQICQADSNESNSSFKFQHKLQIDSKSFINQNDYIYFMHSYDQSILTVNLQKNKQYQVYYKKFTNENQIYSSLFHVELTNQNQFCLKHVISGRYFPFTKDDKSKKLILKPLLKMQKKTPPFNITFEKINQNFKPNQKINFQRSNIPHPQMHGYWLYKANKKQIAQIMSIKNVDCQIWIPYLINNIKKSQQFIQKKQLILRSFYIIDYLIQRVIPNKILVEQSYQLLFYICQHNYTNKKRCMNYLTQILRQPNKQLIMDLLTQLLSQPDHIDDVLEKSVTPSFLKEVINSFIENDGCSIHFLRIFRVFCGPSTKPCLRNQIILFKIFFGEQEYEGNLTSSLGPKMEIKIVMHAKFKFSITYQNQKIYFLSNNQKKCFEQYQKPIQAYIRQYFYLISDCLNGNNEDSIKQFCKQYSEEILNKVLFQGHQDLRGPIISLIISAYLIPARKFKLYIHHQQYNSICFKGQMLQYGNQHSKNLIKFLKEQFQNEKNEYQYDSTTFKLYLKALKLTIENGYWKEYSQLKQIAQKLQKIQLYSTKLYFSSYQEKLIQKNLMGSKILAIEIEILLLDLKINLWISDLILLSQSNAYKLMTDQLKNRKFWKINTRIFKLCSTQNSQLMRVSLMLFYKIYTLPKSLQQYYLQANKQKDVKFSSDIIGQDKKLQQIYSNFSFPFKTSQQYFKIIRACISDIKYQQLFQKNLQNDLYTLRSVFGYHQINSQFQSISFKLQLHESILQEIRRYVSLRVTQKAYQKQLMYWKILLLYALIKDNKRLRDIISPHRKYIIRLLYQDSLIYYVAADILEQIYRNNRKLIITDSNTQLHKICDAINKSISSEKLNVELKDCKLFSLLGVFLETGNRRVQSSYQTIIKGLFKKEQLPLLQEKTAAKMKNSMELKHQTDKKLLRQRPIFVHNRSTRQFNYNIQELMEKQKHQTNQFVQKQYFKSLFRAILYQLLIAMKKPTLTKNFQLPSFYQINTLLLRIGKQNWSLKGKIYKCIDFKKQAQMKQNSEFLSLLLYDLNSHCQKLTNAKTNNAEVYPRQVIIYISNLQNTLLILNSSFELATKFLKQQKNQNQNDLNRKLKDAFKKKNKNDQIKQQINEADNHQMRILIIKIIQRMYLLKDHCPPRVSYQIEKLSSYIDSMEQFQDPLSQSQNSQRESQKSMKNSIKPQQILKYLSSIKLQQFTTKQLKQQKQPLSVLAQQKTNGNLKRKISKFEQTKRQMQQQLRKKLRKVGLNTNKLQVSKQDTKMLQNFIKSLYKVNQFDSTILSDKIKQFLLNFLRQSFLLPDKDQDLPKRQQMLARYQIPQMICSICEQPFQQRYSLFIITFHLANRLLQGGNQFCQEQFFKIFIKDQNNVIFQNIAFMVRQCLKTLNFYYNSQNGPCIQTHDKSLQFEDVLNCQQQRRFCCSLLNAIFKFLQLLCEQNNYQMKNFMFSQIDNSSLIKNMSINFLQLAQTVFQSTFQALYSNIKYLAQNPDEEFQLEIKQSLFGLPLALLDFLVQVCQMPAQQNQIFLCRTDFFKVINDLTELRSISRMKDKYIANEQRFFEYGQQKQHIFFIIERKLVILLRSLLQQNSNQIKYPLLKQVGEQDLQFLINQSCQHGGLQDTQKLKQWLSINLLNPYLENVVDVLIISKILYPSMKFTFANDKKQNKQQKCRILQQMFNKIKSIQVFSINGNQLVIYFPYQPLFQCLTKNTKDFIIQRSAKLNTRAQKLRDFLNCRYIVYQDMQQSRNQNQRAMSDQNMNKLFLTSLILCYVILLLLILFYSVNNGGVVLDIIQSKIIGGLSLMQLTLTGIYFTLWGINRRPIATQKLRKQQLSKYRMQQLAKKKNLHHQEENKQHIAQEIKINKLKMFKTIYFQESVSYHALILFMISLIAATIEVRIYSFALLFLFAKIELLKSILKAISLTWKQLFIVCLLSIVFSFIFGVVTLDNYLPSLYQNEAIQIDLKKISDHCHSLLSCIDSLFTQKIIGQSVTSQDIKSYYGKFISDLIYWGFFQILLINIIGAIIIDKFAEQRNYKQKIQLQRTSKCYICQADRASLQKGQNDFKTHVQQEHNIWNYYFYMYTLEKLTVSTQYTGIQYWIEKQMKQGQIDWFPQGKTKNQIKQKRMKYKHKHHFDNSSSNIIDKLDSKKQKEMLRSLSGYHDKNNKQSDWLNVYSSGHFLSDIHSQRDMLHKTASSSDNNKLNEIKNNVSFGNE